MKNVALLIICTNKYIQFLEPLIKSADKFFLKNQNVTYFVFTDSETLPTSNRDIVKIDTEHREWPWMTLGRYSLFSKNEEQLRKMDYLFYCDVDMLFVGDVGDEILGEMVGTIHPGFMGGRGTPETNPKSLACVFPYESMIYFAGGFNGGLSNNYLQLCHILSENVEKDFKDGIIAIWHDESHLNRYFIDNPPTKVLSPSYCYDETKTYSELPFQRKLLALSKNHKEVRSL
jgi:histo-blood group ABO system transferase